MITSQEEFVSNYQIEERSNDTITTELEFVERFFAISYPTSYPLWNADEEETTYKTERDYVKRVVYNIALSNLLQRPTYSTAFGTVTKIDDYSRQQNDGRIADEAVRYANRGLQEYEEMLKVVTTFDEEEQKENHWQELVDKQNAVEWFHENKYAKCRRNV